MGSLSSVQFAQVARTLAAAAQASGLIVPAFRSPPRLTGSARTVRFVPGGAVVAVVVRGRPFDRVAADMVEGVIVANHLEGTAAARLRFSLLELVGVAEGGSAAA